MNDEFSFSIKHIRFDEHYQPSASTRLTTNFANLARGDQRQENLRNTLQMINRRFNALAHWDNPLGTRYSVELDIVSAELTLGNTQNDVPIPLIEVLNTTIVDYEKGCHIEGVTGNSFSSYVRDYDFSIRLHEHHHGEARSTVPEGFGDLHGKLFQHFIHSPAYTSNFSKPPIICISVSSNKTYRGTDTYHPVLGTEYIQDDYSLTDAYFHKMGLSVRYFMPPGSRAPLAFYHEGDLLNDYSPLELISTISTMDTFQKIYRPEIYNANSSAPRIFKPSLNLTDYSLTRVIYDRDERDRLGIEQGKFVDEHFMTPYRHVLDKWMAS